MKASPTWATRLRQLIVKPSGDGASALQTTSSLGPAEFQFQRACMISAKPSVWSECMCVKKIASSCPTPAPAANATTAVAFNSRITDNILRVGVNYKFDAADIWAND
jgi:hypothetical protein